MRNARRPRRSSAQRDEPEARRSGSARRRARDHAARRKRSGLLGPGDAALARLDVLPSLDGIEPGIWEIGRLEADGVHVLNRLRTLLATHDKLQTSRIASMRRASRTRGPSTSSRPRADYADRAAGRRQAPVRELGPRRHALREPQPSSRPASRSSRRAQWFRRQGVLVQELIPPLGHDLRLVVAAGQVVGAVRRHAAEGEWRTNVALGAEREANGAAPGCPRDRGRSRGGGRGRPRRRRPHADAATAAGS